MTITIGCLASLIGATVFLSSKSNSLVESSFFLNDCTTSSNFEPSSDYSTKSYIEQESSSVENTSSSKMSNRENTDSFIFFTDPHLFLPTPELDCAYEWFDENIPVLQNAYISTPSSFVMCGGDLLNNNDSKEMAVSRIKMFVDKMSSSLNPFYIIVGNHDTNYQGNSFMLSGNYNDCKLSQDELNAAMFGGKKSYYYFDSLTTRYYCFDSGIDWNSWAMDDFRWEQIDWFASNLLADEKIHKTIFIHIALNSNNLTPFMENIGKIIKAYNSREQIEINKNFYDYGKMTGTIDFIEAGHEHKDIDEYVCGGVPVIITTTFSSPETATQPTFDFVCVDYNEKTIHCRRYGDGEDRYFSF